MLPSASVPFDATGESWRWTMFLFELKMPLFDVQVE